MFGAKPIKPVNTTIVKGALNQKNHGKFYERKIMPTNITGFSKLINSKRSHICQYKQYSFDKTLTAVLPTGMSISIIMSVLLIGAYFTPWVSNMNSSTLEVSNAAVHAFSCTSM